MFEFNGLTQQQLFSLLNNAGVERLLSASGISITRYRTLINNIISAKNNKFKARYSRDLHNLLDVVTFKHDTHRCISAIIRVNTPPRPGQEYRWIHKDTHPSWLYPFNVGNSKHYRSCLNHHIVDPDWNLLAGMAPVGTDEVFTLPGFNTKKTGMYANLLAAEIQRYDEGSLSYLVTGKAPHEGGTGYGSRVRVFHTEEGYIIDDVYGVDSTLTKLLTLLPDTCYSSKQLPVTYSLSVDHHLDVTHLHGIYGIIDMNTMVVNEITDKPYNPVLLRKYGRVQDIEHCYTVNTRRVDEVYKPTRQMKRTPTTALGYDEYGNISTVYGFPAKDMGRTLDFVTGFIHTHYGCNVYRYDGRYLSTLLADSSLFTQRFSSSLTWEHNGLYSILNTASGLVLQRQHDGHSERYNWQNNEWVHARYHLANTTIHRKHLKKLAELFLPTKHHD